MSNLNISSKYFLLPSNLTNKYKSNLFIKNRKYTTNPSNTFNNSNQYVETNLFNPEKPIKSRDSKKYYLTYSNSKGRQSFLIKNFGIKNFFIDNIKKTLINSSKFNSNYQPSHLRNLINTNFLRKERIYTKLKYSRTPGYDIVSGGAAVILAGFLGFLVSEKFGIELPDSGDFYYL